MTRKFLIFFLCCWCLQARGQRTVDISIRTLPAPDTGEPYIAGSFNGWRPADDNFKFRQQNDGLYHVQLQLSAGVYEYKITRGGWDKVECGKNGKGISNRRLVVTGDTAFSVTVENWQDNFFVPPLQHTASNNVSILDTAFYMPQLDRKRRVWLYLPADYDTEPVKKYPVLYLHDGQNVFDDATSYSGEWGVDEFFDTTALRSCIVVAIDNGNDKRLNEYCPYDFSASAGNTTFSGKGEGAKYVDFLVQTLKPYIDRHYRTQKNRANTFIAGSSMGGLISLYAVLKYPKVFGGAGIFSPAFWVGPKIFDDISTMGRKVKAQIYFYAGGMESESMVPDMQKAVKLMRAAQNASLRVVVDGRAGHNEAAWRKVFPEGMSWMLMSHRR